MKATYTVIFKTKAEAAGNVQPVTIPHLAHSSAAAAKASLYNTVMVSGLAAYGEMYGPNGLIRRRYNPAGV